MTRSTRKHRDRQPDHVYVHEAGHALARWYFGHSTDRAIVLSPADIDACRWPVTRKGTVTSDVAGVVEGYAIEPSLPREHYAQGMLRAADADADISLVVTMAGIVAEARYRRASLLWCMLTGGRGDTQHADALIDRWYSSSRDQVFDLACRRAQALVRSEAGWAAVQDLGRCLVRFQAIGNATIDRICRRSFGGRSPAFGCWHDQWPPTLRQLRTGFIPSTRNAVRPLAGALPSTNAAPPAGAH